MKHKKSSAWKNWAGIITTACLAAVIALPISAMSSDKAAEGETAAAATESIPETIDINLQQQCPSIKGLPADKKQVKGFTHSKHATEYLKGKEKFSKFEYTDEFTCTACHTTAASPQAITKDGICASVEAALEKAGGPKKMANYYHNTCKSCHSAMKKAGEKTGPTSCKGCHK